MYWPPLLHRRRGRVKAIAAAPSLPLEERVGERRPNNFKTHAPSGLIEN
jgi:hypothetical protein